MNPDMTIGTLQNTNKWLKDKLSEVTKPVFEKYVATTGYLPDKFSLEPLELCDSFRGTPTGNVAVVVKVEVVLRG